LPFKQIGVIHVMTAQSVAPRSKMMKTFTIDEQNNITAFGSQEEAVATSATPFDSFANQKELAHLATVWSAERLVAIWNSLAGVKPVKSFKSAKAAAGKIWERIQGLGEPAKPKAERKAKGGAQAAKGAPTKGKATKRATAAKKAPKAKKATTKADAAAGPREGSKTAQVVEMLQRKNGATLAESWKSLGGKSIPFAGSSPVP
jgi:hypothetical protein